jgi:Icc protein
MDIKRITNNLLTDGIDRRGFLECMGWAGTAILWSMASGVASSQMIDGGDTSKGGFTFVQISDSHIGFPNKAANADVVGTLQEAIRRIDALPVRPDFLIHTGDISHSSKPDEFDTVDQIVKSSRTKQCFYTPGEHDVTANHGKDYLARFGKHALGAGWYSFDRSGVHFISLVNVLDFKAGLGNLGAEQLAWLAQDLKGRAASTPIVVFAHIPLWTVYQQWGWGTADGMDAMALLKPFGSVTVLNGHIHQTMQKVEGNIQFHTAASTAFPQPKPGMANGPGPLVVPVDQLRNMLGLTSVEYVQGKNALAVLDRTLLEP